MKTITEYKTQNESWGFYGTSISNFGISTKDADILFNEAAIAAEKYLTCKNPVEFLDSSFGRHLADELSFHAKPASLENLIDAVRKSLNEDRKMWKEWGKQVLK